MESGSGTNTVGDCSGRLKDQRAAHAVTCCADLLFPVNRRLGVEPGDECFAVCCPGLGSQGVMEAHERLARLGIVEVSVIGSRWGLLCTIKWIDYQHGITGFRKALGHLSERRTQSKDVGPDEHARMLACCGMHEVGHFLGHGDPAKLAGVLRTALSESKTPLAAPAAAGSPPPLEIDTAAIEQTLGAKGTANGGVYQFNIGRAETITDGGMPIPIAMGSGIVINFQPTGGGKAAITGDFVLVAQEVNPVLKTLRDNGIEVTALHSHMLEDQPRLFFMHYWANDDAQKLATG